MDVVWSDSMGKLSKILFEDDEIIDDNAIESIDEETYKIEHNGVASVLKVICSIIWLICVIVAIISIISLITESFLSIISLISSIVTAILTIFIYGFAEIIQILHDIRRKVYYKKSN
jgi:hypothetical protein